MADEDTIVTDVMSTPEQVLAAGGVSKRRRGASRRSPSGQRRRAPTPEPPKDLPIEPDEELEIKSDMSPTNPTSIKRISTTEKTLVTKRSHSSPGEGRQSLTSSISPSDKPVEAGVQTARILVDLSPTKNVIVKRKSTIEKTQIAKRSQSSPGEGRQGLPLMATTGDLQQEPVIIPRRRRLSDDAEKILADSPPATMPKTSPLATVQKQLVDVPTTTAEAPKLKSPIYENVLSKGEENRLTESSPIQTLEENKSKPEEEKSTPDEMQPTPEEKKLTPEEKKPTPDENKPTPQETTPKEPIDDKKSVESVLTKKTVQNVVAAELVDVRTKTSTESPVWNESLTESFRSPAETISTSKNEDKLKKETPDESPPVLSVEVEEKPVKEAVWGPFFHEMRVEWKKFISEHSEQWGKIKSQRNRCIGALIVMIIYCGMGGLIFRFTEGAFEAFYKCGVKRVKRDFVDSLWLGSHHLLEDEWKSQARKKLMELETQLHAAHDAGVTSYSGQRAWSFLNAVVYCLTVVTTIGYGHISPSTTTGRAITIVYAIFGIPMFLILLADFGKLFTRGIKFIWAFVRRVYYTGSCKKVRRTVPVQEVMKGVQLVYDFATFRRPSQMMGESGEDAKQAPIAHPEDLELQVPLNPPPPPPIQQQPSPNIPTTLPLDGREPPGTPALSTFEVDDEFNLPISVAIVILLIYIFVGATIYWTWENWGFFESFYFVFISMSTIGFGDFVPQHPMYMMASIVYLVFGLALTSMCINVVQEKLSDSFRQASAKIGATIGFRVNEEDGSVTPVPPVQIELPEVHNTIIKSQST